MSDAPLVGPLPFVDENEGGGVAAASSLWGGAEEEGRGWGWGWTLPSRFAREALLWHVLLSTGAGLEPSSALALYRDRWFGDRVVAHLSGWVLGMGTSTSTGMHFRPCPGLGLTAKKDEMEAMEDVDMANLCVLLPLLLLLRRVTSVSYRGAAERGSVINEFFYGAPPRTSASVQQEEKEKEDGERGGEGRSVVPPSPPPPSPPLSPYLCRGNDHVERWGRTGVLVGGGGNEWKGAERVPLGVPSDGDGEALFDSSL